MIDPQIPLAIAPIFLLIVLGFGLWRISFPSGDFWQFNNKLVYFVLLPALLFAKISTINFSQVSFVSETVMLYSGFGSAVLFALYLSRQRGYDGPATSSILQGGSRHNSFLALAIAERLLGSAGLAQAALYAAMLIPVTNIVVVSLMVVLVQKAEPRGVVRAILRDLGRNPLLLAVILGLVTNSFDITPIPVLNDMADLLGKAALPMMLVGVGASIRVRQLGEIGLPVIASIFGKMVLFPLVIVVAATALGVSELAMMVAVVYGAVPTAVSGYALAQQMGGDTHLMSSMITVQTALSFFTLPLTISLAQYFWG